MEARKQRERQPEGWKVEKMNKLEANKRVRIEVQEVADIWRKDGELYGLYKDAKGVYYLQDSDGSPDVVEFGTYASDQEAEDSAQLYLDTVTI